MSLRILPLFLLHGDTAMAAPQPRPRTVKGSPGPEVPAPRELTRRDVQSNDAQAALDWLAHVRAGRIGHNSE